VTIGHPVVMKDEILIKLFKLIFLEGSHFIPSGKPGVGMSIGDYLEHEGKDYMTLKDNVSLKNKFMLFLSRMYEKKMYEWIQLRTDVLEKLQIVNSFLEKEAIDLLRLGDYVGFSLVNTPSSDLLLSIKSLQDNNIIQENKNIFEILKQLEEIIAPFVGIAEKFSGFRSLVGSKGFPSYKESFITMNSPSSSGDSSWFLMPYEELDASILEEDNFFFHVGHASKITDSNISFLGGGSRNDRSITLILPKGILFEIQKFLDNLDSELSIFWQECCPLDTDPKDTLFEKYHKWNEKTQPLLDEQIEWLVSKAIKEQVVGTQLDLTEDTGKTIFLRPVISQSYFNLEKDNIETNNENYDYLLEDLVIETNEGYAKYPLKGEVAQTS
jgi:hypothetical protein